MQRIVYSVLSRHGTQYRSLASHLATRELLEYGRSGSDRAVKAIIPTQHGGE